MAHPVVVTARRPFVYEGRALTAGTVFELEPVQAAILHRQGVLWLRGTLPVVEAEIVPPVRVKRRYRRSDLTAEST